MYVDIVDGPNQYDLSYALFGGWPIKLNTVMGEVKILVESLSALGELATYKGRTIFGAEVEGVTNYNAHSANYRKGTLNFIDNGPVGN